MEDMASGANRIVLVHNGHRVLDQTGVQIQIVEQDGGRTLKVFVTDLPDGEKDRAGREHRERFAQSLRQIE